MAPLIVLVIAIVLLRAAGALGAKRFRSWHEVVTVALAIMFLFTAMSHFMPMKHDLAAMIPPPFTGALWIIYVTGVLEIAGAIGLLIPRFRRAAAIALIVMLIALLPANIHAAIANVPLRGKAPTPLEFRIPLQMFWIALLWWATRRRTVPELDHAPDIHRDRV